MAKRLAGEDIQVIDDYAHEVAKRIEVLRGIRIPKPPALSGNQIFRIRKTWSLTPEQFGLLLNVGSDLVRKWEKENKKLGGAVLRLIEVFQRIAAKVSKQDSVVEEFYRFFKK